MNTTKPGLFPALRLFPVIGFFILVQAAGVWPRAGTASAAPSWHLVDTSSIKGTPDFSDVFFTDANTGYITSSSQANIYKTVDGAASLSTQTTQFATQAVHMLDAVSGYTGGASGFVYSTADGGLNWPFHGTIGATLTDISFPPSGGTGYTCGLNGAISSITSSGVTPMSSGVPDSLDSLSFPVDSNEGWVCGGSIILHYTGGA